FESSSLFQTYPICTPAIDSIKEKLVGPMRLRTESDLRSEHKQPAFANRSVDRRHTVLQILLTPGPSAAQRLVASKPRNRPQSGTDCLRFQPEHGAVVEEDIDFLRHPVSERPRVVNADLENRA